MSESPALESITLNLATGGVIHPYAPLPEEIIPAEIAGALSRICRFSGRLPIFWSVAQHSLLVAQIAYNARCSAMIRLQCLLHDAGESLIGDVPSPIKQTAPALDRVEEVFLTALATKHGIPYPFDSVVTTLDREALHLEMAAFAYWPRRFRDDHRDFYFLTTLSMDNAAALFLNQWNQLEALRKSTGH